MHCVNGDYWRYGAVPREDYHLRPCVAMYAYVIAEWLVKLSAVISTETQSVYK